MLECKFSLNYEKADADAVLTRFKVPCITLEFHVDFHRNKLFQLSSSRKLWTILSNTKHFKFLNIYILSVTNSFLCFLLFPKNSSFTFKIIICFILKRYKKYCCIIFRATRMPLGKYYTNFNIDIYMCKVIFIYYLLNSR